MREAKPSRRGVAPLHCRLHRQAPGARRHPSHAHCISTDISVNLSLRVQVLQSMETLAHNNSDLLLVERALRDGHQVAQRTGAAELHHLMGSNTHTRHIR